MRSVWRIALVWLLAVGLPLQGFAAVAMLHCSHGHGAMHASAMPAGAQHAGHGHDCDPAHRPGKGSCSACAACCTAAALPASLVVVAAPPVTEAFVTAASRDPVVFHTDGPERPPRLLLV